VRVFSGEISLGLGHIYVLLFCTSLWFRKFWRLLLLLKCHFFDRTCRLYMIESLGHITLHILELDDNDSNFCLH